MTNTINSIQPSITMYTIHTDNTSRCCDVRTPLKQTLIIFNPYQTTYKHLMLALKIQVDIVTPYHPLAPSISSMACVKPNPSPASIKVTTCLAPQSNMLPASSPLTRDRWRCSQVIALSESSRVSSSFSACSLSCCFCWDRNTMCEHDALISKTIYMCSIKRRD